MGNSPDSYLAFCFLNAPASSSSNSGKILHLHSLWNGGISSFVAVAMAILLFAIASQIGQQSGAGATSKYAMSFPIKSFNLSLKNDFVAYESMKRPPIYERIVS